MARQRPIVERRKRVRFSLRLKAWLAFLVVALFVIGLGTFVGFERSRLFEAFTIVDRASREEDAIRAAKLQFASALARVNQELFAIGEEPNIRAVLADVEPAALRLGMLVEFYPEVTGMQKKLSAHVERLAQSPSRSELIELRAVMRQFEGIAEHWALDTSEERSKATTSYFERFSALTAVISISALAGLVLFAALISLFFGRLGRDIRRLEVRSQEIVRGYRGDGLPVDRSDEVGSLTMAINRMAAELKTRDQQLALAQQQYAHHEKMVAVGTLATGVAHEIGNPIAAISGVAQSIADVKNIGLCPHRGDRCRPDLILQQAERIAFITRQIAQFASPRSSEPELLDLNALVQSTANFVRYDRRYRNVDLQLDLDRLLPAVRGVADHIVQVLMNLLINAADALDGVDDRSRWVAISTRRHEGNVLLTIADNGCGMDQATVDRAFDTFFTTKAPGKGTGLGLAMCRSLVEGLGGRIEIASDKGVGTRVEVSIPVPGAGADLDVANGPNAVPATMTSCHSQCVRAGVSQTP